MFEGPIVRHPDAAARTYESDAGEAEAFIVVPGLGEYNILNPIGSRVFELIDGKRTAEDIVAVICDEYEVSREKAEADVNSFVEDLRKHRIIT